MKREGKLKIRIDVSSGFISRTYLMKFFFPCTSLLLKGGSKGTFFDMLREKLRLMMLRDVTTFSTSSLVLSAPPPPEKIRQSWISMDHADFSNLQLPFLPTFYILVDISLVFQTFLFRIKKYIYIYKTIYYRY